MCSSGVAPTSLKVRLPMAVKFTSSSVRFTVLEANRMFSRSTVAKSTRRMVLGSVLNKLSTRPPSLFTKALVNHSRPSAAS